MKALSYAAPDHLEIVDIAVPKPQSGEILIKVHYAGICGTDIAIAQGKHPRAKPPLIPGHEFAGEVVEIGPGCGDSDIAVGDRVTAYPLLSCGKCWSCLNGVPHVCKSLRLLGIDTDGFMAEYATCPVRLAQKLPPDMPYEIGALVEVLAVGIHAVAEASIDHGDTAVVIGAGPIGLVVALSIKLAGAAEIILTDINPYRVSLAESLGFRAIDVSKQDAATQVLALTDGNGADFVFEAAGTAGAAAQMTELARCKGKIMMVSVHKAAHEVDLRSLNFKELSIIGTRVYTEADYARAIAVAAELPVERLISHKIPLADSPSGFDLMAAGSGNVCKVLINTEASS